MARLKGSGKGITERFNIRLDEDTAAFYRSKANENGISSSEYLRQLLMHGVIADNVREIELRLQQTAETIQSNLDSQKRELPDEVILSIFTCEALLTAIVEARDVQQLYEAQNKAKSRLDKLRASS